MPPSLSISLSLTLSLHHVQEQFTYCQMRLRRTQDRRLWRSFFQWGGGTCWHKDWDNWAYFTILTADWPSKSLELRAGRRAGDMPCPNRLTWLVTPATRPAPVGLSEREMCAGHSKECTNLLFIKCGVTWDWRLNGDLSMIQPPHRRSLMACLCSTYGPC